LNGALSWLRTGASFRSVGICSRLVTTDILIVRYQRNVKGGNLP
jgi:hypothetical protein